MLRYLLLAVFIFSAQCSQPVAHGIKAEYDLIILGMGTFGSTVFGRLNQAGAYPILGVDLGGDSEFITTSHIRTQWGSYNYFANPDANRGGYSTPIYGGKGAGGSMYLTNNGWEQGRKYWWDRFYNTVRDSRYTYNTSQCLYDRAVVQEYPTTTGRIQVRKSNSNTPLGGYWATVGTSYGYGTEPDCNDYSTAVNTFCFEPSSTRWSAGNSQGVGSRDTSWAEYVRPIWNSTFNDILLDARVIDIKFCDNCNEVRPYAVVLIVNGTTYTVKTKHGVILGGGGVNNAHILQTVGIGNATLLKSLGIRPLVDLPAVGQNLADGGYTSISYVSNMPSSAFAAGTTTMTNTKPAAFLSTTYAVPGNPDMLLLMSFFTSGGVTNLLAIGFNIGSTSTGVTYPFTKDPLIDGTYEFSYLSGANELNRFTEFINITRSVVNRLAAVSGYTFTETGPTVGKNTPAQIQAMLRGIPENGGINNMNHWASTVRMGPYTPTAGFAIDPDMRPYGTQGLYVGSSSAFPYYPGDGGAAPSVVLGEYLAAQLTKKYYGNSLRKLYGPCGL